MRLLSNSPPIDVRYSAAFSVQLWEMLLDFPMRGSAPGVLNAFWESLTDIVLCSAGEWSQTTLSTRVW